VVSSARGGLALKSVDAGWIASGLAATAAADSREIPPGLSAGILVLLFHAGRRVSPNEISSQFRNAAELADRLDRLTFWSFCNCH